ncbi:MAG: Folylpolyglutamate synthetase [Stictis urceolatum]|nr:Folylpolyglutamate synthetase [Stictis urceolata]
MIRQNPRAMHAQAMPEMHAWLQKAGYRASDFSALNAIHIAGTKGKGSTSTFISSILAQYLAPSSSTSSPSLSTSTLSSPSPSSASPPSLHKIGLYTSPHLRFVRERIQLNNTFLSPTHFATHFFQIWDHLTTSALSAGLDPSHPSTKPAYFRFLTILGLHTFLTSGVDAAIIECGTGGEYDSTNVLERPVATAITALGIDHVEMLGGTIEEIAWHKAGIMKRGARAFTVPQPGAAMEVLERVAGERGVELVVVGETKGLEGVKLGLEGAFQRGNASLAVRVAAEFLERRGVIEKGEVGEGSLPEKFVRGLEKAFIGGRCETRADRGARVRWRIDGAHTMDSIQAATEWFAGCVMECDGSAEKSVFPRILLFNQQGRGERVALLQKLHATMVETSGSERPFTHAVFCTNKTFVEEGYRPDLVSINTDARDVEDLKAQKEMAEAWTRIYERDGHVVEGSVKVVGTIEEAVRLCRDIANGSCEREGDRAEVFVTGSLHLVGGVLDVLES